MTDEESYLLTGKGDRLLRPSALSLILGDYLGEQGIRRIDTTEVKRVKLQDDSVVYEVYKRTIFGDLTGTERGRELVQTITLKPSEKGFDITVNFPEDREFYRLRRIDKPKNKEFNVITDVDLSDKMDGVVVIDIRDETAFCSGAIAGSKNLPHDVLEKTQSVKSPPPHYLGGPLNIKEFEARKAELPPGLPQDVIHKYSLRSDAKILIIGGVDS